MAPPQLPPKMIFTPAPPAAEPLPEPIQVRALPPQVTTPTVKEIVEPPKPAPAPSLSSSSTPSPATPPVTFSPAAPASMPASRMTIPADLPLSADEVATQAQAQSAAPGAPGNPGIALGLVALLGFYWLTTK